MRAAALVMVVATVLAGCVPDSPTSILSPSPPSLPPCSPGDPSCGEVLVRVGGVDYRVGCQPVAKALVDVVLGRSQGRTLRAIAGVASSQAVAVLWRDPDGCGLYTLALATHLSPAAAELIRDEMIRGVERFGVTASPVPRSPEPAD
jgi:hypothetical protein